MRYDVALSYSFSHGDDHERAVFDRVLRNLEVAGVEAFMIHENAQLGKHWGRKYYEGAFHSHFLVPVLSRAYLSRVGTQQEMKAMDVLVRDRMRVTFFCPIVPIVPDVDYLKTESLRAVGDAGVGSLSWLKTHAYPVVLEWGAERVARFFESLVAGARGRPNLECLRIVQDEIRSVEFGARFGRPSARVQLENRVFEDLYEFHVGAGGIRFAGCVRPPREAVRSFDPETIVDLLAEHSASPRQGAVLLCEICEFRRSSAVEDTVCPLCSSEMVEIEVVAHEPKEHEMLTCEDCGTWGHPASYIIGAECSKCGGQMSELRAHEVLRIFSDRYGRRGK